MNPSPRLVVVLPLSAMAIEWFMVKKSTLDSHHTTLTCGQSISACAFWQSPPAQGEVRVRANSGSTSRSTTHVSHVLPRGLKVGAIQRPQLLQAILSGIGDRGTWADGPKRSSYRVLLDSVDVPHRSPNASHQSLRTRAKNRQALHPSVRHHHSRARARKEPAECPGR